MTAPEHDRGRHLVRQINLPGSKGGLFASMQVKLSARFINAILARIDAGLQDGAIEGHLPDGTKRLLGNRRPGPQAIVHVHS